MSEEHPNAHTKWTEDELKRLDELYSKVESAGTGEVTLEDISEELGRSVNSIRNKAYEEGFNKPNFWSKKELEILKKHYEDVKKRDQINLDELADKLDKHKTNICRKAKELGLTDNSRGYSESWREKLSKIQRGSEKYHDKNWLEKQYLDNDLRIGEIAEKANANPTTIGNYLKEYGIKERSDDPIGERKETYTCAYCGEEIEKWPSQVTGENVYCSYKCIASDRVQNRKKSIYSDSNVGNREDLDQFFRSSWEANYARYLNFIGTEWEYEPKEFEFEEIKRGTRFYTPDFYLPEQDQWIEVKGWFRDKDKTKLKRFKKYYPDEFTKLILVIEKKFEGKQANTAYELGIENIQSYKKIKDNFQALIDNWE